MSDTSLWSPPPPFLRAQVTLYYVRYTRPPSVLFCSLCSSPKGGSLALNFSPILVTSRDSDAFFSFSHSFFFSSYLSSSFCLKVVCVSNILFPPPLPLRPLNTRNRLTLTRPPPPTSPPHCYAGTVSHHPIEEELEEEIVKVGGSGDFMSCHNRRRSRRRRGERGSHFCL